MFNNTAPLEAATSDSDSKLAALALGDKDDVGQLAGGMSRRWVDDQMVLGMPHLKIGKRRVRFDLQEVREWLKEKYHVQRRAPAHPRKTEKEDAA